MLLKNVKGSPGRLRKKLQGGCSCGTVRYQLLAAPIRVHCCHCTDCQRHTGSAFVINAIIETSAIKIMRGALEAVPVPRAYAPHDIYRCRKCKVALWSDYGHRPQILSLIHISEPTRQAEISYAVFCLK